ncbi:hypothetical protein EXIGLDRAFT_86172 [Exidia glandulosa HHB12029]|uniref:F-box domain-containing protein n=1 Tax=Exidia glandulosa HHB12029 TaxID=1314781 RepID=A0A165HER0_EXIGL|nr:hypothetical protein EXIGLDRAFT_86172 [Exidia glandulosa HHB12029]
MSAQKLPYDCLEHITHYASNSQPTLAALSIVSRDLNHLVVHYLYRRVCLKDGDQRCGSSLSSVLNNDTLARRVESLDLDSSLSASVLGPLASALSAMRNLRHIYVRDLNAVVRHDVTVLSVIQTLTNLRSIRILASSSSASRRLLDRLPAMQSITVDLAGNSARRIPELEQLLLRSRETLTSLAISGDYDLSGFLNQESVDDASHRYVWKHVKQLSLHAPPRSPALIRAFPNATWLSIDPGLTDFDFDDKAIVTQRLGLSWWREMRDDDFRYRLPRVLRRCIHLRHLDITLHQEVLVPAVRPPAIRWRHNIHNSPQLNSVFMALNDVKWDGKTLQDLRYVSVSAVKRKPDDYAFSVELNGSDVEVGSLFAAFPRLRAVVLALMETPSLWRRRARTSAGASDAGCSRELLTRGVDVAQFLRDMDDA